MVGAAAAVGLSPYLHHQPFTNIYMPLASALVSSTHRKDQKKVDKLTASIPYHEGRGNKEEVTKIKGQIEAIWEKAREAQFA